MSSQATLTLANVEQALEMGLRADEFDKIKEILDKDKPIWEPNTADMPNCAENTPPSKNIPTQPNGELLNSCARLIGFVRSKAGVGLTDNKIGAKEIDTSIEIIMNKL